MGGIRFIEESWRDLCYGMRILSKTPGFTAVAIITLAFGIGANIAILCVADGMLFRPLPFKDPERLVEIIGTGENSIGAIPEVDWIEVENHHHGLEGLITSEVGFLPELVVGDRRETVRTDQLSLNYLQVLGVTPLLGRSFLPRDHEPGNNHVALLTHQFWRTDCEGDPGILGKTLTFAEPEGTVYLTVVGVLPPGWVFPETTNSPPQILTPLVWRPNAAADPKKIAFPIARLRPGVSLAQAQAELDSIMKGLRERYPQVGADRGARLAVLQYSLFKSQQPLLFRLLGAAGFLLFIACANLASLLLSRGLSRARELSIRSAIGAGRLRLIRQLLAESLLLGGAGGAAGILLVYLTFDWLMKQLPNSRAIVNLFQAVRLGIDGRIVMFTAAFAILSGFLVGIWPAIRFSRSNVGISLRSDAGVTIARPRLRQSTSVLIATEVALVFALTVGAGLMLNSFVRQRTRDLGFDPRGLIEVNVQPMPPRYKDGAQRTELYKQLLERLRRLPLLDAVAGADGLPLQSLPGRMTVNGFHIITYSITPEFFETLHTPLLAGRTFSWAEQFQESPVVVVDELTASQLWPGQNPLGKTIAADKQPPRQVIGVVGTLRSFKRPADPRAYVPLRPALLDVEIVARARGKLQTAVTAIRWEIAAVDSELNVQTSIQEDVLTREISDIRFETLLLGILASLALILSIAGIFGVVSYSVSGRTHEIGVRRALGAEEATVLRMILIQTLRPVAAGILVGLVCAFAMMRILASKLYEITPHDTLTYGVVTLLLLVAAFVACWSPARRAAKIDPAAALRHE